jgi:hypothetical protein
LRAQASAALDSVAATLRDGGAAVAASYEQESWLAEAGSARASAKARALSLLAADRLATRREGFDGGADAARLQAERVTALTALRTARSDVKSLSSSTQWASSVEDAFRRSSKAPLGSLGALGALGADFQPAAASEPAAAEEEEDTAAAVDAILSSALSEMGLDEEEPRSVRVSGEAAAERMAGWISRVAADAAPAEQDR